ncbi:hypothetical protein CI102_14512 [Trichoderma harzianum]|nr:hypothetical protein CI102_14512 [Trichoderma harzianum]
MQRWASGSGAVCLRLPAVCALARARVLCWMRLWLWSGRAGRGELSGGQAGLSICLCLYFYTRCAVPATNGVSLNVPNASLARNKRGHVPHCWSPVQPLAHQLPRFDGRIMDVPVAASEARCSTCILSLFLPPMYQVVTAVQKQQQGT